MKKKTEPDSVVPQVRQDFLIAQCAEVRDMQGSVAEVGVYKGGTARILANNLPEKRIHLFDTFEGMPPVNPKVDIHKPGDFDDAPLESVQAFLKGKENVKFWPGMFPESAQGLEDLSFCLVHVDVDIYESTKSVIEFFWPLLVEGGIMVFDDYNAPRCPGTNKAVDEYFGTWQHIEVTGPNKRFGTRCVKRENQ